MYGNQKNKYFCEIHFCPISCVFVLSSQLDLLSRNVVLCQGAFNLTESRYPFRNKFERGRRQINKILEKYSSFIRYAKLAFLLRTFSKTKTFYKYVLKPEVYIYKWPNVFQNWIHMLLNNQKIFSITVTITWYTI